MIARIAVATPHYPRTTSEALANIAQLADDAATAGAQIVCFPETYIPGYPTVEKEREWPTRQQLEDALQAVCRIAQQLAIAIIIPMDWYEGDALMNVAQVIDKNGTVIGRQAKNQLDPSEDDWWTAGSGRQVFEIDGLCFGIVICHEGFRYPETVRWMARQGAHIVFHPNYTGSYTSGRQPHEWGERDSPY